MKDPDEYSEAETAKRRDKVLGVLLSTPPKPHVPKAKSRVRKATAKKASKAKR